MRKSSLIWGAVIAALTLAVSGVNANNLQITNVMVIARDKTTAFVQFDISWENSWRKTVNGDPLYVHDAAWVFFKALPDGQTAWLPVTLEGAGVNPTDYNCGSGTAVELAVPADRAGMFVRRAGDGQGTTAVQRVKAVWNFATNGLTAGASVKLRAFGVEMAYVATGAFQVGDGATDNIDAQFETGVSGQPFAITNSGYAITLGGGGADSLGNHNATNMWSVGEDFCYTNSQTLPAAFPNGYAAFYCMKYEITQGQYADFLNSLTRTQQITRANATTNLNYYMCSTNPGSATIANRCTIQLLGDAGGNAPLVYTNATPDRACNFLIWDDVAAFADWAGLRPLTELEFEKACRGPLPPLPDEYAWGSTNVIAISGPQGTDGAGTEYYSTGNAQLYGNGGPTWMNDGGPLRAGIFATPGATREMAGASYWGIMDLSGDLDEWTVWVGKPNGRNFTGAHGDGALDANGQANVANWPPTGFSGSGLRGGNYGDANAYARVSDRHEMSLLYMAHNAKYGGRAARMAP